MKRLFFYSTAYYFCWFSAIFCARHQHAGLSCVITVLITTRQYYYEKKVGQTHGLLFFMGIMTLIGALTDTFFLKMQLIDFHANIFGSTFAPPWTIALWVNFSFLLFVFFEKHFLKFWIFALLSLPGFSLAYLSGVKLGAADFTQGAVSLCIITVTWAVILPVSLLVYKKFSIFLHD